MKTKKLLILPALLGALFVGYACSSPETYDTKPMLTDLATKVALPTMQTLDADGKALDQAAQDLAKAPSADTLAKAQAAWRKARKSWKQADMLRFGPADSEGLTPAIEWWPAGGEAIDREVSGTAEITPTYLATLGAQTRGLAAIEYLLFDSAEGDAAVLARLTAEGAGPRRLAYAAAASTLVAQKIAALRAAWEPAYTSEIATAGFGSKAYTSQKAAVDQLVNQMLFVSDSIAGNKIGNPFGNKNGGVPQPALEEAPRSDASIDDMLASLKSIENVYLGQYEQTDTLGLTDLVRSKSPALDARVRALLTAALSAITAIPKPFRTAITAHRAEVEAAYKACVALKRIVGTEVASVLGITLKFNDNDGD